MKFQFVAKYAKKARIFINKIMKPKQTALIIYQKPISLKQKLLNIMQEYKNKNV